MSLRHSALLLLGHGSTLNADSSLPTYRHAEEIRRRGLFAEVIVAFWKEEPNFRQALRQTACREIYAVPNFISSGYFTEQVIPRELGLAGPTSLVGHQQVHYCDPVGLHPSMTEALLQRARDVVAQSSFLISEPAKTACLFICGHGTSFNDNSTRIIHEQAEKIRSLGLYADCQAVLMEQKPFVKDWRTLTNCPDVIVAPFFISDGLHSFEDIPVLLGLTTDVKKQALVNPHREGDRRLWYATAIGTDPFIADVILAQVEQFREKYSLPAAITISEAVPTQPAFIPTTMGEIVLLPDYELRHRADAELSPQELRSLSTLEEIRELIRVDADGDFRPLRAAPNLRRGWRYLAKDSAGVRLALDYFYPAELANAELWKTGALPLTPWQETAERQTGRFRVVREIDDTGALELIHEHCEPGCLKQRLWAPGAEPVRAEGIPLLCPEACNYLVGKAREKIKGGPEE